MFFLKFPNPLASQTQPVPASVPDLSTISSLHCIGDCSVSAHCLNVGVSSLSVCLLTMWPQMSYLYSVHLGFFISKLEMVVFLLVELDEQVLIWWIQHLVLSQHSVNISCYFLFIHFRERVRNIHLLFHLFMHSLIASCMCPDWRSNPQPWLIGTTL